MAIMIPVCWVSFNDTPARCRWDQSFADWLLPESEFQHIYADGIVLRPYWGDTDGGIVVYPAGENGDQIDILNQYLEPLDWVVLLLTSDECSSFPVEHIRHRNMRLWVQSPRAGKHTGGHFRHLPVGAPAFEPFERSGSPIDVGFIGQVTHQAREDMVAAFTASDLDFSINSTAGFTEGLPRDAYLRFMARTKVAPCPSGPCSADTFRLWEALEMGCVPIVDQGPIPDPQGRAQADYPRGFWELLFGETPPFPVVEDWADAPARAQTILDDWPASSNRVFAAYQLYKRDLRRRLLADVAEVSGMTVHRGDDTPITVVIPTSPVPSNPETSHLETVVASVREWLPNSEILVMFDGVRSEQEHLRAAYEVYQRDVLWKCSHVWSNVIPFRYEDHLHQVEMFRRTLEHIDTPLVLFIEHDTPLVGDIPFDEWSELLLSGHHDLIRTYHETVLQREHLRLMDGQAGDYLGTRQFSARPHLARTQWYREILHTFFSPDARTFIEDKLHSVAESRSDRFRMLLYTPSGDIQRSTHLDTRGDEPKFTEELVF